MSIQYHGSIAYHSIAGATLQHLQNAKPYYELAIEYWKGKCDNEQIKFFKDGLDFINERMSRASKSNRL